MTTIIFNVLFILCVRFANTNNPVDLSPISQTRVSITTVINFNFDIVTNDLQLKDYSHLLACVLHPNPTPY